VCGLLRLKDLVGVINTRKYEEHSYPQKKGDGKKDAQIPERTVRLDREAFPQAL
jgi:hypothetical protein